jgi:hypothetical protein
MFTFPHQFNLLGVTGWCIVANNMYGYMHNTCMDKVLSRLFIMKQFNRLELLNIIFCFSQKSISCYLVAFPLKFLDMEMLRIHFLSNVTVLRKICLLPLRNTLRMLQMCHIEVISKHTN